jgi:predicted RND superfamily exporter protein
MGPWQRLRARLTGLDHQRAIDWSDERIVNESRRVVLTFLVVTGIFMLGLGNISTSAGTQQFTTGLPSEDALESVNREFSPSFSPDTGSTQLIQQGENVLGKPALLRMLRLQERIQKRPDLRATATSSAAQIVAQRVDPTATDLEDQIIAIERATRTDIDRAVRDLAANNDRFTGLLSTDFNRQAAAASATIGTVTHEVPAGIATGAGQSGSSPLTPIQQRIERLTGSVGGDSEVFGTGLIAEEFSSVILDSLLIVIPAALLFILLFLVVAYRDLADLLLGLVSLFMAIVWTFGFMGLLGISFSQMLIAVPPLLLAVGIDFGIHSINRYREERELGRDISESMRITSDQLVVAFFIVTGTTVIGFAANFASSLAPIRDFGFVASIGIVFTFFIFGVFLPAAKVELDRLRDRYPIPTFSTRPLGSEGSPVASVTRVGVVIAKRAPALFLVVVLLASAGAGVYATGVDTSFTQEDFLPPEDSPDFLYELPEPFRPGEYTVTGTINFLEDNFASTQGDQVTIYLQAPMLRESSLASIQRAGENPPGSILETERQADAQSIVSVIQSRAAADPEFRALVARNDPDDDGVPEDNLREVYAALLSSPARGQAVTYIAEDYGSARVVYSVEADASQAEIVADARDLADRYRADATATGQTVVFQSVSNLILESAAASLTVALIGASMFLVFIYLVLEDAATLGVVNTVPILVTVAFVAASMRAVGIPFNAITATILAITIGLGIDYSVHITHRFADERRDRRLLPALDRTVRGTGGALLGSMLTTVSGIGVLSLALFTAIQQFGLITGLSILYSFLASLVVLPSALVIWDHFVNGNRSIAPLFGIGTPSWRESPTAGGDAQPPEDNRASATRE